MIFEVVEKVKRIKAMSGLPLEVDGVITEETAPLMVEAGAQVSVAGSAVYRGDPASEMRKIIDAGRRAVAADRRGSLSNQSSS